MTESVNLSYQNLSASDIIKLAEDFTNFSSSKFLHSPTLNLSRGLNPSTPIRTVKLGYNDLGDDGAVVVSSFLAANRTITCLDLGFNRIGDIGIQSLATVLKGKVSLEVLYLSGNLLTSVGFKYLSDGIARNKSLKSLYLTGNNGREDGAKYLSEGLLKNTTISKLYLNGNRIVSRGCSFISQALLINSSIKHINLSDNSICDHGLRSLAEALTNRHYIKELELSFNAFTHVGMEFISEKLIGNTAIKRLLLDNNKIGDIGAKYLARALPTMQLTELNIGFNGIDSEGLIEVINAIYANPSIESLILSGNNITNTVSKVIANMLLHNYNLRQLFLDHANIGPIGEKYIAAGIAKNKRSGVRHLTGFQLGKVLASLGSPPHIQSLSNEATLTYLALMWEAHNMATSMKHHTSSDESSRTMIQPSNSNSNSVKQIHSNNYGMNPTNVFASNSSIDNAFNPRNENLHTNNHFHAGRNNTTSTSTSTNILNQTCVVSSVETNLNFPDGKSISMQQAVSSSPMGTNYSASEHITYHERECVNSLANKSKDFDSFPFLSKLTDSQMTGKDQEDIDAILSYSEKENTLRSNSCHVDLDGMSISVSQTQLGLKSKEHSQRPPHITVDTAIKSYAVDTNSSYINSTSSQLASAVAPKLSEKSCFLSLHLKEIVDAAKALASKPFNAAELWELHQFYFSPPVSKCGSSSSSAASNSRYSHVDSSDTDSSTPRARHFLRRATDNSSSSNTSDDDDDDESDQDIKRYDHYKNRVPQQHSAVSGGVVANGATVGGHSSSQSGGKGVHHSIVSSHVSSRKRRATMSTMIRISQFPKVKEYLNAHKTNEVSRLTLLRQLKFLESFGTDLNDTAVETILLNEIFNQ
eukprot:CAMPEP_0170085724 /NCGR_PEP_ID=MMETSP0019_2-20121128/20537_1 /TAXON_ID=98059 /ORGANISM="Dinobryon sp., Strain UTEXLB2267" /LENGTH=869 /DNA_ID=CAMNT_0010302331 /DNA_START=114 /DNA_END=2723 /DNA_ORIENTATION=-